MHRHVEFFYFFFYNKLIEELGKMFVLRGVSQTQSQQIFLFCFDILIYFFIVCKLLLFFSILRQ